MPQPANPPAPLLDLDTLITRPTVLIDGTKYELLSPDELSVLDAQRFSRWARQMDELQQAQGPDAADDPALSELTDLVAGKVLVDVPPALFAKLSGMQKLAVTEVFTALLLRHRMGVAGAVQTAMGRTPSTGANSFPGSSGSTAGPPASGWKKRLLGLFGVV